MSFISLPYLMRFQAEKDIPDISVSEKMMAHFFEFIRTMEGNELYKAEILWYEIKDQYPLLETKLSNVFIQYTRALNAIRIFQEWGEAFRSNERKWMSGTEYIALGRGFVQLREALLTDENSLSSLEKESIGEHLSRVETTNQKIADNLVKFRDGFFAPMKNEIRTKGRW